MPQLVLDGDYAPDHPTLGRRPYAVVRRQLIILGCFSLSEAIAWTALFPYIYSMVQSFSKSGSGDQSVAVYAGVMVSVFTFGEFVMAPQWAKISDYIGRKPTVLIGSMGAILSSLLFGLSGSLPMAIFTRLCAGLLNPNLGVVQTFIGELVSKDQQAKGFSVVPFLRGFGTIIGPVIGGYLAEPVRAYPSIFHKNTVWDHYPYLLPNLVVALWLLISSILGLFCLEESNSRVLNGPGVFQKLKSGVSQKIYGKSSSADLEGYIAVKTEEVNIELDTPTSSISSFGISEKLVTAPVSPFNKQVVLQILSVAILGFLKISTLTLVPILLATPLSLIEYGRDQPSIIKTVFGINRGYGLDSTNISNVLLSQAVASILSQVLWVPAFINRHGPLRSYKLVLMGHCCLYFILPFAAVFPFWAGLPIMLIFLWTYSFANSLSTTCSVILLTNTVPSPMFLATVNGAAASFGCLARTLGPLTSGPLFQLGLNTGYLGIPFWFLGVVTGAGIAVSFYLEDHN